MQNGYRPRKQCSTDCESCSVSGAVGMKAQVDQMQFAGQIAGQGKDAAGLILAAIREADGFLIELCNWIHKINDNYY